MALDTQDEDVIDRLKILTDDLKIRIHAFETKLQDLREARVSAKSDLPYSNRFSDEGTYVCRVTTIRGGSIEVARSSVRAVVVVEQSVPFLANVKPYYRARKQEIRRRWNTYHSIIGTFTMGVLEGLALIRYSDGSFYEGPYIDEKWLDAAGRVRPAARAYNHYGVYRCGDGRTFEGKMIDNHFDPNNLQSFYRLTLPQGEVYEGLFCDETYHGTGMYKFKDGSIYEGHWHQGQRFGHGHLRNAEGWTYEGGFNSNKRHGRGVITYKDGSMYMGRWYYDKMQGHGCWVTTLRDVYKGDIVDGMFQGAGELLYADGSRYRGTFRQGHRHGKGIQSDKEGIQYYGTYRDDFMHGEHIVKEMIAIEEYGQQNFEIRIGVYDMGHFIKWKLKYSNPLMTKQFIALFEDPKMFDSVYSMNIAKALPTVPEGVDRNDPGAKAILLRIRNEAGDLVGQGALKDAQDKFDELMDPIKAIRVEIEGIKKQIDKFSLDAITVDKEAAELMRKFHYMIGMVEKDSERIEQFWIDEPSSSRHRFQLVCESLNKIEANEFFKFRNHRIPPPFTKKIMNAISILMGTSDEWKKQQLLISTSVVTGRSGDDLGLRFEFDCKLAFMMKEYKVYDYTRFSENNLDLESILCDPRMRRDSYYVESCGPAGPALVDWIKATYLYVTKSRQMIANVEEVEDKKNSAFRLKAASVKKSEEVSLKQENISVLKESLAAKEEILIDLQDNLGKVNELLEFISSNDLKVDAMENRDYYQEMEAKIEEKRDFFVVETCVQFICEEVESRRDIEKRAKMREAKARGEIYEDEEAMANIPKIGDWLQAEVTMNQVCVTLSFKSNLPLSVFSKI